MKLLKFSCYYYYKRLVVSQIYKADLVFDWKRLMWKGERS